MKFIYAIQNIINDKIYIGQSKSVKYRLVKHKAALKRGNHENIYLQHSWNKYGPDCFMFFIIASNLTDEQSDFYEIQYIEWYKSLGLNYNITDGGYKNPKISQSTIEKLRNSNLGKKLSEETKQKISQSCKGKYRKPESTQKAIQTKKQKGYKHSQETIEKIRKSKIGTKATEETKQILKNRPRKLRYFQLISPDGIIFNGMSLPSFCKEYNLNYKSICRLISGERKTHKGWKQYE